MANTKIPSELVAINAISGTLIADNAITSVHIAENQVHSVQIAQGNVTALHMADGTITSAKIADGTIVTADIADGQITTGKLADSSVTTAKIAAGTILGGDIANNAILTQHIDDNQITADQIADNAVGIGQLASIARGKIIVGDSAGNPALLALGAANTLLQSDGTDLVFAPLQSGIDDNSNAVAITIDSSEKVSIGGTNPTYKFVVSNNNAAGIEFGPEYATDANLVQHYDRTANAYMDVNTIAQNHRFSRGAVEHMRITNTGRVGIGTNNPGRGLTIDKSGAEAALNIIKNNTTNQIVFLGTGSGGAEDYGILQLSDAGAVKVQVYSAGDSYFNGGNVGIGTASPSDKLHVRATDTTGSIRIGGGNGANNHRIFISAHPTGAYIDSYGGSAYNSLGIQASVLHLNSAVNTGNVGIGTASPSHKLHVQGTPRFELTNGGLVITKTGGGVSTNSDYMSALLRTDTAGYHVTSNNGGFASVANALALMNHGDLILATAPATGGSANYPSGRIMIKDTGNVGIGNDDPNLPLTVTSNSGANAIAVRARSADDYGFIQFYNHAGSALRGQIFNHNGAMAISTDTTGTARLHIDTAGNVGIGVTSIPSWANLMTSGTVAVGGVLYIKQDQKIQGLTAFPGGAGNLSLNPDGGNVGIGTDSPAQPLHVFKGESGGVNPNTDSTLVLENSSHTYINFLTPSNKEQGILFGDAASANTGMITYSHSTDNMSITAADDINLSGDVLNYSNSAGTGYFHMSGSSSRYADHGFWAADNYQLEVGNAHMYLKTQTSAKDIILGTHNTERMRISGSGHHIGMGTGNHFVIAEDGAGTYLGKDNNSSLRFITANGTRMTITNTGKVGIGTSPTNAKVHILGDNSYVGNYGYSTLVLEDTSGYAGLNLRNGNNNWLMRNAGNNNSLQIVSSSDASGPGTGTYTPRLVIMQAGNVGIGDDNPGNKLEVNSPTNYQGIHIRGSNAPCFTIGQNSSSTAAWRMGISGYDGADFAISSSTGTNDRLRMDPDGNMILGSANNFTPIAMHKDVATVAVRGPIASGYANGSYNAGPRNLRDWFVYAGPTSLGGSGRYVHMKTDLWAGGSPNGNTEYTMSLFRYHSAYSYGNAKVSEGMIGWHNWSGLTTHQRIVHNPVTNWAIVKESYTSSDGYVVLVADILAAGSYAQFSIDWFQWGGYPFRERKVTAVTLNTNATGAY